jgi:uncharacterized protein
MDVRGEPLTEPQVRILGVLVEKQLATPQAYPLTEKALQAACNQTTNREPVVTYDTSVLRPALIRLRERGLTRRVRRAGERADKHAHRLEEQLGLSSTAPLAVLSVLLLRGAQTPGELRARTQRLHPLPDAEALSSALAELAERGLATELPRRPGEKQARWRHRLDGASAQPSAAPTTVDPPEHATEYATQPATGQATRPREVQEPRDPARTDDAVRARAPEKAPSGAAAGQQPTLWELTAAVAALQQRVSALEQQLADRGPDRADGRA